MKQAIHKKEKKILYSTVYMRRVLEVGGGNGHAAMWIDFMPLHFMLHGFHSTENDFKRRE